MQKGDVRRDAIIAVLQKYPNGLMANQVAPKAQIYENKLAYYHLRVLIQSGLVEREIREHGNTRTFFYWLK